MQTQKPVMFRSLRATHSVNGTFKDIAFFACRTCSYLSLKHRSSPIRYELWRSYAFIREDNPMPEDAKAYWESILNDVQSTTAQEMLPWCDLNDVTGLPKFMKKKPNCLDVFTEVKKQHPEKIILVENGNFFEAVGHDAVLLVDGCQLNPTSAKDRTPLAGFQTFTLPKFQKRIVDRMQLSLVVCEQCDPTTETKTKYGRRIKAIYVPGEQGFIDDGDDVLNSASSMMCLSWERDGFTLLELPGDQSAIYVLSGMTEDALWGKLISTAVAAPICVHRSFAERVADWRRRLNRVVPRVSKRIRTIDHENVVEGFETFLKSHFGWQDSHVFDHRSPDFRSQRRCSSFFTALQLGLTGNNCIPNLLDFLVPSDCLVPVKAWFKDLLLAPRSMESTFAIQKALELISEIPDSIPIMKTYLSPRSIAMVHRF